MSGPNSAALSVRGIGPDGTEALRIPVPHGADPEVLLRSRGWDPVWLSTEAAPGGWVLTYRVTRTPLPTPYQRAASYVVVFSRWQGQQNVLLTSFTGTRWDGLWGLPGGGIDDGEDAVDAAAREVMEETGQQITDITPLQVVSQHWVGRSPKGRLEDFHAVRMVYTAQCPHPVQPVVHDVGGTTAQAGWFTRPQWERLPVMDLTRTLVNQQWRQD